MNTIVLPNGVIMPDMSFGCWRLGPGAETTDAVAAALEIGYRSFDTAYSYGNDFHVARALKKSGLPRGELFVTNKVWNAFRGEENVVDCCKKSLRLMKLDYFDLYLVHWPAPTTQADWVETNLSTWRGMERLYRDGLVRAIGVSNFGIHHLEALYNGAVSTAPMVNQVEFHPGYYPEELLRYCRQRGVTVSGWSPQGNGGLLSDPVLAAVAEKHRCSVSQCCLAWELAKGVVPVPRSKNPDHMRDNLSARELLLDPEDTARIDAIQGVGWSGFDADSNQPS